MRNVSNDSEVFICSLSVRERRRGSEVFILFSVNGNNIFVTGVNK